MKLEIPKFKAMAWAKSVLNASSLSCNAIEMQFMPPKCHTLSDTGVETPRLFNKYLLGQTTPKKVGCECGGMDFVDRIETVYPGTKRWLELNLWKLVTDDRLELTEIWKVMSKCKIGNHHQFFLYDNNNHPLRISTITKEKLNQLVETTDPLEALTFLIGLLREAEILKSVRQHLYAVKAIKALIPKIYAIPEFSDFTGRFFDYIEQKFFRVIYNVPDSAMNLVYTSSWRDEHSEIHQNVEDFIKSVNDASKYRSLYGAPSNIPPVIDLTGLQIKRLERVDKIFEDLGAKPQSIEFELQVQQTHKDDIKFDEDENC